ncbi:MAG: dihydrolipoamide acetyltransferase family protein [Lautropia sp.]|nr:dihydrolipoamide acetyltransferase family protein [Lautropia sp.]
MGIHIIKMPDIGEGIAEVELVEWHVKVGDTIQEDQVLAEVMTDKAAVEIPSPVTGVVKVLGGTLGQMMAVGTDLITIEVEGEGNVQSAEASRAGEGAATGVPGAAAGAHAPAPAGGSSSGVATGHAQRSSASAGAEGAAASSSGASAAGRADRHAVGAGTGMSAGTTAQGTAAGARGGGAGAGAGVGTGPGSAGGSAPGPQAASGGWQPAGEEPAATVPRQFGEAPLASPAVRRRAWDLGIELRFVPGSGPHGRIRHEDLDAYVKQQAGMLSGSTGVNTAYLPRTGTREVPVIGLRRKIAEKMQESKRRIPHFSYVEEMDVTALEALRNQLNAQHGKTRGKLSLIPFIARAMVLALRQFPQINARFDDEAGVVTRYEGVHLGVAVQTPQGLVVAVVRHAESRDLWGNATEVARLAELARAGRANREELSGSTITLSSLGALGGIVSTPVINHPEVGIIAVNRIVEKPVVHEGQIAIRKTMNLSSSFDHRVVDGMDAAAFIQAMRQLLENPAMLFID